MSRKHTKKLKRKRGQAISELDFLSPLTPEVCLEHLKAGRSPFKTLDIKVVSEGEQFQIGLVSVFYPNSVTRASWVDSAEPIWFEGQLEPTSDGLTHVRGRMFHDSNPEIQLIQYALIALGLLMTLAFITQPDPPAGTEIRIVSGGFLWAIMGLYFIIRKRRIDRLSATLSHFISERLDVQRTTKHDEHNTD